MSSVSTVAGVILAAGDSSRMGRVKQMLPFNGKSILRCVVENAVASSLQSVIVVIGHEADRIEPMISGCDVTIVINRDYKAGQSASVKLGLYALPEGTEAVLYMQGDQPLVGPGTINRILDAYRDSPGPIVFPVFNGKRGNPVLFSSETFSDIELLNGDSGARPLFEKYAGMLQQVQVDDPYIHFDIDTEDDYRRLLELEHTLPGYIKPSQ